MYKQIYIFLGRNKIHHRLKNSRALVLIQEKLRRNKLKVSWSKANISALEDQTANILLK